MKLTQINYNCSSAEERKKIQAALGSVIFWSHINLNGEYDFNKDWTSGENLNLEKLKKIRIK